MLNLKQLFSFRKKTDKIEEESTENKATKPKRSCLGFIWNIAWRTARILSIAIICALFIQNLKLESEKMKSHDLIHTEYNYTSIANLYVEDMELTNEMTQKISTLYKKTPKMLYDIIVRDWMIVVSKDSPFEILETNNIVKATTYYGQNVIWITPEATDHEIIHEFGHVLSFYCGGIDQSFRFTNIYRNNWDTYIMADGQPVSEHCVSSSMEFFAEMYAEYILHPEYFKANFSECYDFLHSFRNDNAWRLTHFGTQLSLADKILRTLCNNMDNWIRDRLFYVKNFGNEIKLIFRKRIDTNSLNSTNLSTYKYKFTLDTFELVQDIIAHPELYNDTICVLESDTALSVEEFNEANTSLNYYFLDNSKELIKLEFVFDAATNTLIYVYNLDKQTLLEREAGRKESLTYVDNVLAAKIKNGNEKEMMLQVMAYILEHTTVDSSLENVTQHDFWQGKVRNHITYAMIFQQFAHRLGIHCDIVISPTDRGTLHVFNRITLNDGTYVYYDVINLVCHQENLYTENLIIYGINSEYR
jgi:hypothetical protein